MLSSQSDNYKSKGVLYFKLKDTSSIQFPEFDTTYSGTYPYLQDLIDYGQIKEITRSFKFLNHAYFNKIYRVKFSNQHQPDSVLTVIRSFGFIEYATFIPKYGSLVQLTDTTENILWHARDLGLDKAFNITQGDSNVVIAVSDGPINQNLTDISGKFWKNSNETPNDGIDNDGNGFIDDCDGWDMAGSDNNPFWNFPNASEKVFNKYNHGTMVTTLAVGSANNPNSTVGTCPECKVMPLTIYPTRGSDTFPASNPLGEHFGGYESIAYAVHNRAKIVNLSWGGLSDGIDEVGARILDYADSVGVAVVAGAGNNGNDNLSDVVSMYFRFYPADYPTVISVGAYGRDRYISKFSTHNPVVKVDVLAPGEDILTGKLHGTNKYISGSGTSLSTPLVSGIIGLMWSNNPSLSLADIKTCLINACDSLDYKNFEYRNKIGNGALNAENALNCIEPKMPDFYTKLLEQTACLNNPIIFHARKFNNVKYFWHWGDGTVDSTLADTIVKQYHQLGKFTIQLIQKNTISGMLDTLIKSLWFHVTNCGITPFDYSKHWGFGKTNVLNFNQGGNQVQHQATISTWQSTCDFVPLGTDSAYIYHSNDSIPDVAYSRFYLWKNTPQILNGGQYFDSVLKINTIHRIPGILIPDMQSDSFLLISNGHASYNMNRRTIRVFSISKTGVVGSTVLRTSANYFADSTPNGSLNIREPMAVVPSKGNDWYRIIVSTNSPQGRIYSYKLFTSGFQKKLLLEGWTDLPNNQLVNDIIISPNNEIVAIEALNKIYIYHFTENNDVGVLDLQDSVDGAFGSGSCFSPSSKLLYAISTGNDTREIIQINLEESNLGKRTKLVYSGSGADFVGMQLGVDSIIYVNVGNAGYLSAITNPNNVNAKHKSNECGFVKRARDLNTSVPLIARDPAVNSRQSLPSRVFHNIPAQINIQLTINNCDSGTVSSNFPKHIYRKWKVNGANYTGVSPKVRIYPDSLNTVQLIVDSLIWYQEFNFSDSIYPAIPEINNNIKTLQITDINPVKLYLTNTDFKEYNKVFWYKNGNYYDSLDFTDTLFTGLPGIYHAVGITNCGTVQSKAINVVQSCSHPFVNSMYSLDTGMLLNTTQNITGGVYLLTGNNRIISGGILDINAGIVMAPGSKITVYPGGKLLMTNCIIRGCGDWKGIEIIGNPLDSTARTLGSIKHGSASISGSTISGADVAVQVNKGGFVTLSNDTFINNGIHVVHNNYAYNNMSTISGSVFKMLKPLVGNNLHDTSVGDSAFLKHTAYRNRPQILLDSVRNIAVATSIFQNTQLNNENRFGIPDEAIRINKTKNISINNNTFQVNQNDWTVNTSYSRDFGFTNNTIEKLNTYGGLTNVSKPKTCGILLKQVTASNVQSNTFTDQYTGVEYYLDTATAVSNTTIKQNAFDHTRYGLVAATDTFPLYINTAINNYTNTIYLKTACNEFNYNQFAFVACGKILEQGKNPQPPAAMVPAENIFISSDSQNCIWYNNGATIDYTFLSTVASKHPLLGGATVNPTILINGFSVSTNNCVAQGTGNLNNSCATPSPFYLESNIPSETEIKNDVTIYPNPSRESFKLEILNQQETYVTVYSINGMLIDKFEAESGHIFGNSYNPGLYLVVIDARGKFYCYRIIKQ